MTEVQELPFIDGELILNRRHKLGLSRDRFAQIIEMRPGALWRLEVRNVFKPGEREHLANIADRWLTGYAPDALPSPRPASKPAKPTATVKQISVPAQKVTEFIINEDDEDLIQWADPLPIDRTLRLRVVFPLDSMSPTTMSLMDGFRRVSNSEIATFKRCRRKWWLVYLRGLRSVYESPFGARATGTRIHAALAAWYRPEGEERIDPRDALEIIIESEREQVAAIDSEFVEEIIKKFNAGAELERVIIAGYMEWIAETGIDSEYTVIGSERYLEAILPEVENTMIIARLDARVVRKTDKARLFIDHKSVASIPGAIKLLPLNEQMQWYILLEQLQPDLEPGQRVGGALYNMLRRTKRSATAQPPFYQRVEVHHNPIEIESFRKRLVGTLDDMKFCREEVTDDSQSHQLVVYPNPTRDCAWDCPFLKVCPMADDGSRFEDALEAHYVVGDPYSYYQNPIERKETS